MKTFVLLSCMLVVLLVLADALPNKKWHKKVNKKAEGCDAVCECITTFDPTFECSGFSSSEESAKGSISEEGCEKEDKKKHLTNGKQTLRVKNHIDRLMGRKPSFNTRTLNLVEKIKARSQRQESCESDFDDMIACVETARQEGDICQCPQEIIETIEQVRADPTYLKEAYCSPDGCENEDVQKCIGTVGFAFYMGMYECDTSYVEGALTCIKALDITEETLEGCAYGRQLFEYGEEVIYDSLTAMRDGCPIHDMDFSPLHAAFETCDPANATEVEKDIDCYVHLIVRNAEAFKPCSAMAKHGDGLKTTIEDAHAYYCSVVNEYEQICAPAKKESSAKALTRLLRLLLEDKK
jgi:hypothetical protein